MEIYWQDVKKFGQIINKNITDGANRGSIFCIDWGSRYCGFAISDDRLSVAMPIGITSEVNIIQEIDNYTRTHNLIGIVIGLPIKLNFDGFHEHTPKIVSLAKKISINSNIPVLLWDERMSTVGAANMQNYTNVKKGNKNKRGKGSNVNKNKRQDDIAAHFILDGLLDLLRKIIYPDK